MSQGFKHNNYFSLNNSCTDETLERQFNHAKQIMLL